MQISMTIRTNIFHIIFGVIQVISITVMFITKSLPTAPFTLYLPYRIHPIYSISTYMTKRPSVKCAILITCYLCWVATESTHSVIFFMSPHSSLQRWGLVLLPYRRAPEAFTL